jgi:Protein of unknown function (DUF1524)
VAALQGGDVAGLVGEDRLEAVTVGVAERQLGAGVRALAADDHARAGRPACAEVDLDHEQHAEAVLAIESWIVRRMITGANTRGYAKVFIDVRAGAKEAPQGEIALRVLDAFAGLTESMAWPTDEDIETAFLDRRMYGQLTHERLRMILGAIDADLQALHHLGEQASFDYERLQIEHVMPQSWSQHWPIDIEDAAERELAEQRRRAVVDRIGNLTLITAPLTYIRE